MFKNYSESREVQVRVPAVIFVPNKVLIAICFSLEPINNKFPHFTLFVQDNKEEEIANKVVLNTCNDKNKFKDQYENVTLNIDLKASVFQS